MPDTTKTELNPRPDSFIEEKQLKVGGKSHYKIRCTLKNTVLHYGWKPTTYGNGLVFCHKTVVYPIAAFNRNIRKRRSCDNPESTHRQTVQYHQNFIAVDLLLYQRSLCLVQIKVIMFYIKYQPR